MTTTTGGGSTSTGTTRGNTSTRSMQNAAKDNNDDNNNAIATKSSSAVMAFGTTDRGCKYYDSHGDYYMDAIALEDPTTQRLYSAQATLPKLPVPTLEDTCTRFLPTALPLAQTPEEAKLLEEDVAKFPKQAQELQNRLQQRAKANPDTSWLQYWWNTMGYLQVRDPIVINVSYFFWCDDDPKLQQKVIDLNKNNNKNSNSASSYSPCVARSAALLPIAIEYAFKMRTNQTLPETMGKKTNPITICSTQKKYMYHSCRIPHKDQDYYRMYFPTYTDEPSSQKIQIVIACRGQFFAIDIPSSSSSQPLQLGQRQWRRILKSCIDKTTTAATNNGTTTTTLPSSIGWCTGLPRNEWAETRQTLLRVGGKPMEDALEVLQSSLFMLCMDIDEPINDHRDRGLQFWHGGTNVSIIPNASRATAQDDNTTTTTQKDYHNRYYDKSAAIIVTQDGGLGFQGEHSMLDGMPFVPFNHAMVKEGLVEEDCLEEDDDNYDNDDPTTTTLPRITNIFQDAFDSLTPEGRAEIDNCIAIAKEHLTNLASQYDLHVQHYYKYGANVMKKGAGCSPDAYIQMAMQLATYRMIGEGEQPLATYESTQVMRFLHGRTETTRTVSPASLAFCKAMDDNDDGEENDMNPSELRRHRLRMLQDACKSHVNYISNAVNGQGVDRHFMGLSLCLEDGEPVPDLFTNPLFVKSKRYRVSTSCLPDLAPGFGPVVSDGLGMGYEPKAEACYVHVTARKEYGWTEPMCEALEKALDDMRSLYDLDETSSSTSTTSPPSRSKL